MPTKTETPRSRSKPATEDTKALARQYDVRLTRKAPRSEHRIPKSEAELRRQVEERRKNYDRPGPKCRHAAEAINEKVAHHGGPCPPGTERTPNFCVKKLATVDPAKVRWYRTLSPRPDTRITIACRR